MRDGIPPDTHPRPQSALANTGPAESDYSSCTFACTPEPAGFQADDEPGQRLPERVVVQYAHQPSLLRPAPSARPHNWMELEAITLGLTGRPPETGYRELVVPVFRLAQMEIDREGRQPGEANAWIDPGPRFLDRKPIDVSALEAMRTQWAQVMAAVARLRQAYLDRYPLARSGMTLGDLERLSALVLAVVASPQVKKDRRGARELH